MPYETPEYAKFVSRIVRRYGVRVGEADDVDLYEMSQRLEEFESAMAKAIEMQLIEQGRSWRFIARSLRQPFETVRSRWLPKLSPGARSTLDERNRPHREAARRGYLAS